MSGWKISGPGEWFAYDSTGWTADPDTDAAARPWVGRPVALAPNAGLYEPTGPGDEVGLFLLARELIPGGVVTGQAPRLPVADYDPEVVY